MEYEASSGEILPLRDSCSTSSWSGERRENDCMGDLFIQMVIVVLGKEVTTRARHSPLTPHHHGRHLHHGRHHHRTTTTTTTTTAANFTRPRSGVPQRVRCGGPGIMYKISAHVHAGARGGRRQGGWDQPIWR